MEQKKADFDILRRELKAHFTAQLNDETRQDNVQLFTLPTRHRKEIKTTNWWHEVQTAFSNCQTCLSFIYNYGFIVFQSCQSPLWSLPLNRVPESYQAIVAFLNVVIPTYVTRAGVVLERWRPEKILLRSSDILGCPQTGHGCYWHLSVTIPLYWRWRAWDIIDLKTIREDIFSTKDKGVWIQFKRRNFALWFRTSYEPNAIERFLIDFSTGDTSSVVVDVKNAKKPDDLLKGIDRKKYNLSGITDKMLFICSAPPSFNSPKWNYCTNLACARILKNPKDEFCGLCKFQKTNLH